nr:hypothetical protein [Cupriavidus campinensis]
MQMVIVEWLPDDPCDCEVVKVHIVNVSALPNELDESACSGAIIGRLLIFDWNVFPVLADGPNVYIQPILMRFVAFEMGAVGETDVPKSQLPSIVPAPFEL